MAVAARNLGLLMRLLFGIGTPRSLQGAGTAFRRTFERLLAVFALVRARLAAPSARSVLPTLRFAGRRPFAG